MSVKPPILIVEDEKNLGMMLTEYLTSLEYQCHWGKSIMEANELFQKHNPSIVLMDIGLPDGSGIELAKSFREKNKSLVLLFLSALNDPETRVQGLEIGAEDYITKPFAIKELVLRLERIIERSEFLLELPKVIEHGPLKIWPSRYEVQDAHGNIIPLGQKENAIFEILYKQKGEAVTREQIIEDVWGLDTFPSNRTVDNYIVKLRKWCETDKSKSMEIISVRGIGYKLSIKEEE